MLKFLKNKIEERNEEQTLKELEQEKIVISKEEIKVI
jgi:hypothetical protein